MTMELRYIKIGMIASIALLFSMFALNNITDFETNWTFVKHVMSMDTTFQSPAVMYRSVTNPGIQKLAYYLIIVWEAVTALFCWMGCLKLALKINASDTEFNASGKMAFTGLFTGFLLYMVGFIIVGGEWFCMWQSSVANAQMTAGLFAGLIMLVMIFLRKH